MRYATFLSALLHVGILAGGFIIAPFLSVPDVVYRPVVPVELLSEAEFADLLSVKADQKSEEVTEEPPNPRDDIQEVAMPDPIPVPQPEDPTPPEPEVKEEPEDPAPREEPKREDPPKREPDPQPAEEDDFFSGLDEALVDLEDEPDKGAPAEVADAEGLRDQEQIGLGDTLTASEIDLIRQKMAEECFDQPTGVPNAEKLVVRIRFNLDPEGQLIGQPEVLNARQIALSNNSWWRTTRDRALQAVVKCAPYDYLPEERYYVWSEMTLNFTPLGVM
ncbi:hypothetical protein [Parvularcula lutaonensis]|uniref:Cell envelope biogenesis protein TolA n=1 Tax=Parvularcula lutaonensis TaxID=491923 RepID=A0ABV7MFE6_9PROT|nr:hypothetical protein [Parvularcula lutaonensis]GGY53607.1 hypothetical protein GCM10007148_23600 [Parvularcula lutaonensis]